MSYRAWLAVATLPQLAACALPVREAGPSGPAGAPDLATNRPACIAEWVPRRLPGKSETLYALDRGTGVVEARASGSSSLVRRPMRVEPAQLGSLVFSWKASTLIPGATLKRAEVADSVARVVLAFDGDHGQLSGINQALFELASVVGGERPPYATLNYVWDGEAAVGEVIVNQRIDRVRSIVVESGPGRLGGWLDYRRDIAADFIAAYGEPPGPLIAVGLMTDADNTGGEAVAWYGPVCLHPAPAKP